MKRLLVAIALFVGIFVAAACGGAAGSSGTTEGPSRPANYSGTAIGSQGGTPVKGVPDQSGGGTVINPNGDVVPPIQGPQVIRQAQLAISVKSGSFDSSLAAVRSVVEIEHGYVSGTDAQANPATNDGIRTGVITFMVPASNFDATIDAVSNLGKVQTEHIGGQDVSAQYFDLQARLANQEAQRNAMLALLGQAKNIPDIIAIQNQIGQITGQIEQLKGQIQYIEHNVAFSTITVTLTEAGAPVAATPSDSWGFATALTDAAHNFVTTVNYVITFVGAVGPVLVILGLGYLVWRRAGRPGWRRA